MPPAREISHTLFSLFRYTALVCCILAGVLYLPKPFSSFFIPTDKAVDFNDSLSFTNFLNNNHITLPQIKRAGSIIDLTAVNLPDDLSHFPASKRTSLFITLVLSHAVKCNEKILLERKKLIQYILDKNHGKSISQRRHYWMQWLARKYRKPEISPEQLLNYVDIIPVSMTIAQAITESGWGTSRFARQGNALYGQHLPQNSTGKYITSLYGGVKVAAFDSIIQCTQSYIHNLNTSLAYATLRAIRKEIRIQGKIPDGFTLAEGLLKYSEIGEEYIRDIRFLIGKYNLAELEATTLNRKRPAIVIRFDRKEDFVDTVLHHKSSTSGEQVSVIPNEENTALQDNKLSLDHAL